MLKNFITDKYIRLDIECSNWEEAIRKSGEQLLKEKKVTEEYIEDAVNSVKELGPYIVVAKGIAVPHTSSHIGVKENGITITRLKSPVEFGNKRNDPVKYIFMMATTDFDSHIEILSQLSEYLKDSEFLEIIENAKSSEDIMKYIISKEKLRGE